MSLSIDESMIMMATSIISSLTSVVALLVSIIALVYTSKTFFLKLGADIKGVFAISSSHACKDKFISSVTLENFKDRSVAIYKIFLRFGSNCYLEIEDFEEHPLILKPFEAYTKTYEPIDFYSSNTDMINLNTLFDSKKIKAVLVLSTSEGRYLVRPRKNYWDPIYIFFKNHLTEIVHPMRSTYKEKSYGSNSKYIVDLKTMEGREETIPIYPDDWRHKKFRDFNLTSESLESKEALEEYLYDMVSQGNLNCTEIEVKDIESWRKEAYDLDKKNCVEAEAWGWAGYHIIGKLITIISNLRIKFINRAARKRANKSG